MARLVFNLKAIEFGAFFAYFHLFRHLKVPKFWRGLSTTKSQPFSMKQQLLTTNSMGLERAILVWTY